MESSMKRLIIILILVTLSLNAFAINDSAFSSNTLDANKFKNVIGGMGTSYTIDGNNVNIIINKDQALAAIPVLQKTGEINPDITQDQLTSNSTKYAGFAGLFATAGIVPYIYKNSNLDVLNFNGYLMEADDYGNTHKKPLFSFSFDRKLFNKINWENFKAASLEKVAYSFKLSNWYMSQYENNN